MDDDGVEFVSLIEAKGGVPIWGSQFHPEKNAFEWTTKYKVAWYYVCHPLGRDIL